MKRALVIDDDPYFRELLARLLAPEFEVLVAFDGDSAQRALAAEAPDLVMLDIYLPGATGLEVLGGLREDPRTAALPVVAFSAFRVDGRLGDALERRGGVSCLLDKLSPPRDFLAAARRAAAPH